MRKFIFLSAVVLFIGCDDIFNDTTAVTCDDIACTENFVSITISVRGDGGTPVALDRFEVIDLSNQGDLTTEVTAEELQEFRESGNYPLLDDLFVEGNKNTARRIIFRGFINNEEVVSSEYIIATDCCHIRLVEGRLNLVIL